jgi:uncharacterized membrane protein YoaK (UPF0700 family)
MGRLQIMINKVFAVLRRESHPQQTIEKSVPFGVLLAVVGGFLEAYTFITRGGVFANAQTGNIIRLGIYASEGQWSQALIHIPPILAFVAGVVVAEWIRNRPSHRSGLDWESRVLLFEMTVLLAIGLLPQAVPNIVVTVAVSFACSVQVSSFRTLVDSPYATTMSTGNLRSASQAAYVAITTGDRAAAIKAIRYFTIILAFISGGFIGGLVTMAAGVRAVWVAALILGVALGYYGIGARVPTGATA